MGKSQKNWYKTWFDSPYYHLLYQHRDENEASLFIQNLVEKIALKKGSVLDMACGRGRHSKYFHLLGFQVTGIDLSKNNIAYAKQFEKPGLHFLQRDMLIPMEDNFDVVTNLFTSMGYFPNASDNWKVIQAMHSNLKLGGYGIIDFLNINYAEKLFPSEEIKILDGVKFTISKTLDQDFFYKNIKVEDNGKVYEFEEKLKKITKRDFEECLKKVELEITHVFGDHDLSAFHSTNSKRLILVFKK